MFIRAGKLDRLVHLVRRGEPVDDGWQKSPGDWLLLGKRRASIMPAQRREHVETAGLAAQALISIWLRWDSISRGLTGKDAIVKDGYLYELTAEPIEIGRRQGVELLALRADPATPIDVSSLAAA